jgi:Xaa-Pro aminopeptidase
MRQGQAPLHESGWARFLSLTGGAGRFPHSSRPGLRRRGEPPEHGRQRVLIVRRGIQIKHSLEIAEVTRHGRGGSRTIARADRIKDAAMVGGATLPAVVAASHTYDRLEERMIFVLHTQWLEPTSAGCNIGDLYLVTADGFENLSRHTPLETHRVAV